MRTSQNSLHSPASLLNGYLSTLPSRIGILFLFRFGGRSVRGEEAGLGRTTRGLHWGGARGGEGQYDDVLLEAVEHLVDVGVEHGLLLAAALDEQAGGLLVAAGQPVHELDHGVVGLALAQARRVEHLHCVHARLLAQHVRRLGTHHAHLESVSLRRSSAITGPSHVLTGSGEFEEAWTKAECGSFACCLNQTRPRGVPCFLNEDPYCEPPERFNLAHGQHPFRQATTTASSPCRRPRWWGT